MSSILSHLKRKPATEVRIAHVQVECPHCCKVTDAYIAESASDQARVECMLCAETFEFGPGTMYKPVGFVPSVPQGAKLAI